MSKFFQMSTSTDSEVAKKAEELIKNKACFMDRGMPVENTLCPEMYKLSKENKFVFFK